MFIDFILSHISPYQFINCFLLRESDFQSFLAYSLLPSPYSSSLLFGTFESIVNPFPPTILSFDWILNICDVDHHWFWFFCQHNANCCDYSIRSPYNEHHKLQHFCGPSLFNKYLYLIFRITITVLKNVWPLKLMLDHSWILVIHI